MLWQLIYNTIYDTEFIKILVNGPMSQRMSCFCAEPEVFNLKELENYHEQQDSTQSYLLKMDSNAILKAPIPRRSEGNFVYLL